MLNSHYGLGKVEASHTQFGQGEVARSRTIGAPV